MLDGVLDAHNEFYEFYVSPEKDLRILKKFQKDLLYNGFEPTTITDKMSQTI